MFAWAVKSCSGMWHVAQDIVPYSDNRRSKNNCRPNSIFALVNGFPGGIETRLSASISPTGSTKCSGSWISSRDSQLRISSGVRGPLPGMPAVRLGDPRTSLPSLHSETGSWSAAVPSEGVRMQPTMKNAGKNSMTMIQARSTQKLQPLDGEIEIARVACINHYLKRCYKFTTPFPQGRRLGRPLAGPTRCSIPPTARWC